MDGFIIGVMALAIGWFVIGAASAFILAAAFFGVKEEKILEEE
jgi:hypothetical protein